ncbi:MAG: hypothetical protein L6Q33_03700 [Bacteriovoracaceae bacterium]|nr:hypothetical protein [Bacteriovoracaceae bacterium]
MKAQIVVILSLLSPLIIAQSTGITTETQNQQIIYNNAVKSEAVKKNKVGKLEMTNTRGEESKIMDLTDQEKQLSENFIHQGKANRIVDEQCNSSDENKAICAGRSGKHKFMGMDPAMVQMVSKAYAMIGAMGDVGELSKGDGKGLKGMFEKKAETPAVQNNNTPAKQDTGEAKPAANGEENKKASDYCKYIPTATETIAQFQQMSAQQTMSELPQNQDTAQRDAFEKSAKAHDERAKQSQMQAVGWYGGAACYAARMATGGIAVDWASGLKLGAATLLGTFYQNEVGAHKEYAAKVREISAKLPGKGDCNPITDRLCYCSEPSTENDPQYCLKEMHKKAIAKNSVRTSCINDQMKSDPQCKCETSDTCFDKLILTENGVELGLSQGFANSPFKGVRDLVRGELKGGTLSSESYSAAMAAAKKALQDIASKLPEDNSPPPTGDKKKVMDELIKRGFPALIAKQMALAPMPPGGEKYASKFQGGALANINAAAINATKGSNVLEFGGGNGLGTQGAKAQGEEKNDFDLSKFASNNKGKTPNAKVLSFLEKAQNQATIAKKDQAIFEIISNRYQLSGRKRLEVEGE